MWSLPFLGLCPSAPTRRNPRKGRDQILPSGNTALILIFHDSTYLPLLWLLLLLNVAGLGSVRPCLPFPFPSASNRCCRLFIQVIFNFSYVSWISIILIWSQSIHQVWEIVKENLVRCHPLCAPPYLDVSVNLSKTLLSAVFWNMKCCDVRTLLKLQTIWNELRSPLARFYVMQHLSQMYSWG